MRRINREYDANSRAQQQGVPKIIIFPINIESYLFWDGTRLPQCVFVTKKHL